MNSNLKPPTGTPPPTPGTPTAPAAGKPAVSTGSLLTSSTQAKFDIAAMALRLRDEQVQAKVIYFGADQQTNKELDAITEAVVAELMAIQTASTLSASAQQDRASVEIELINTLRNLLEKLFSPRREGFLRHRIEDIQKRITNLFFDSELYSKISSGGRPSATRTASFPNQALFLVIHEHEAALLESLRELRYDDPSVLEEAIERLQRFQKGLLTDYLSRTTPELDMLLEIFRDVLTRFFYKDFHESMGEFCWEIIKESRVAQSTRLRGKLSPDSFQTFRTAFDKKFLERLVLNVQEPMVQKAGSMKDTFRAETLAFMADPHIFLEICTGVCNAVYDHLHTEGFLELPPQWRAHLYQT